MSREKNKWNVRGISFSGKELLYQAAAAKAKRLRRSFSNYVCGVLEDDLAKDGSTKVEPSLAFNDKTINLDKPAAISQAEQTALDAAAGVPDAPIAKYPPIPVRKRQTVRRPSRKKPVSKLPT